MQSKLSHIYLKPIDFGGQNILHSCHLFQSFDSEFSLLLNTKNGSIVLLNNDLLNLDRLDLGILKDDDVYVKLKQRNFIMHFRDDSICNLHKNFNDYVVSPNFFLIDLTKKCNLNCKYCFRESSNEVISDEIIDVACKKIQENCKIHKIRSITIQPWGGEPLLIPEKIERIYQNFLHSDIRVHFTLETNGTLLTKLILDKLSNINMHIGISIDGCQYIHDLQRPLKNGTSSYNRILDNVRVAQKHGYHRFSIISVLTKESLPYLEKNIDTFLNCFGIRQFKFNPVHNSSFKNDTFGLSSEDIENFFTRLFEYYVYSLDKGNIFDEDNITQRISNIFQKDDTNICCSRGCQGGYRMISIGINGDVYPCELIDYPQERIGNILENRTLNQMITSAISTKRYFKDHLSNICNLCPWVYFCRGGCTSKTLYYEPNEHKIDTTNCSINKTIYPLIINRILSDPNHNYRMLR